MAASRTALLLLGLMALATMGAEAKWPPAHTCSTCPANYGDLLDLNVLLNVDLRLCPFPLHVVIGGVVKVGGGDVLGVCLGGKLNVLGPLQVRLKVKGVLELKLEVWSKNGKKRLDKKTLVVPVEKAAVKWVGDVYHLAMEAVYDEYTEEVVFYCGDAVLLRLDIKLYIKLLGIIDLGLRVGLVIP